MSEDVIQVSRAELQAIFRNPRLVRVIERLINMTQDSIPAEIVTLTIAVEDAASSASSAASSANSANALLASIAPAVEHLESLPTQQAHVNSPDDPSGRLEAIEAKLQALASEVESLKQGTMP